MNLFGIKGLSATNQFLVYVLGFGGKSRALEEPLERYLETSREVVYAPNPKP